MLLVDTHCHLDLPEFEGHRQALLELAKENGIGMILDPATNLSSSHASLALAHRFDEVYSAVGVHPNDANEWNETSLEAVRELAQDPKCLAIGEIGLDYYWDTTTPGLQKQILAAQLQLAEELELPVIIHNRESDDDCAEMLCDWQRGLAATGSPLADRPGVFHSFSGSPAMAEKVLAHNFYIGITGPVTFKKADELRSIVRSTPVEKLLVETDSPYLSPEPHRGKQNQPAHVRFVANKVAEVKGLEQQDFYMQSTRNAEQLFQIELVA